MTMPAASPGPLDEDRAPRGTTARRATTHEATTRQGHGFDAVALLTVWIVLLVGISARQGVPGFGAIGSPATLLALTTFGLWAAGWVLPTSGLRQDPHPMRPALLLLLGYQVSSYAVATSRSLTALESTGSMRALLLAVAMAGIGLLVADGVQDLARLKVLLRRLVGGITVVATIGIVQFFTRLPLQFRLPGLQWNSEAFGIGQRSIFGRPAATTLHPIEFSVVTAALLPLAIHFALHGRTVHQRRNAAGCAALIALAVPMSISRSGILSLVVGLAVLAIGWDWRLRLKALLVGVAAVPVLWAAIPGLVGTLIGLFTDTDNDPSIQARIDRRPRIMELIRQRPVAGLGHGTWSIEDWFLIDNQLYVTTLEMGLLGMALVILVLLLGAGCALLVGKLPGIGAEDAHLGQAIAASIIALSVSITTFDAFHYRILTGSLFVLLGAAGALWRLHDASEVIRIRSDG